MNTTFSEVYYQLSKRHAIRPLGTQPGNTAVLHARIWRGQAVEPGCLYIVDAGDLGKNPLPAPSMAIASEDSTSSETILEDASDVLLGLERWDGSLKDAALGGSSLKAVYDIGETMIPELLSLVDPDLSIIVTGDPFKAHPNDINKIDLGANGSMRLSDLAVSELLEIDDYAGAAFEKDVFLYPSNPSSALYICGNVFAGEENCARLVADCPQGLDAYAREGAMTIFRRLLEYIRQVYLRNWQDERGMRQNDDLHRVLRLLAENPQQVSTERLLAAAQDYGWKDGDEYIVVYAQFLEGAYWHDMASYICSRLEESVLASAAAPGNGCIVWVCDLSKSNRDENAMLFSRLASAVCDYRCKAGVSRHLSGISQVPMGASESMAALAIGQLATPNYWYYRFEEYAPQYLLAQMTREFPVTQLVHPGIGVLEAYDTAHGTDYLATLKLYFDCGYNVSEAAEQSYVHRTTFSRRLDRIQEIGGFDPRNPDTRLYLVLSFWMLAQEQKRDVAGGQEG